MFWFVAVKNLDMIYEPLANRPCCLKFPACACLLQGLLNQGAVSRNICWAVPNFAFELLEQWCQKQFRKQHHPMKWTARIFLQWQVKLLPKHQIFLACCSVRRWLFLGSQKVFWQPVPCGKIHTGNSAFFGQPRNGSTNHSTNLSTNISSNRTNGTQWNANLTLRSHLNADDNNKWWFLGGICQSQFLRLQLTIGKVLQLGLAQIYQEAKSAWKDPERPIFLRSIWLH